MHQDTSIRKKQEGPSVLEQHYLEQLKLAPDLQALIGDKGAYIAKSVRGTADYSYHATQYSGDHYRLIGDAAGMSPVNLNMSSCDKNISQPLLILSSHLEFMSQ